MTNQAPLVTIGVPLHNGAVQLEESLSCLKNQTFTDFQVIIFENQSSDNSLKIAQSFVERDARFSLRPSEELLSMRENFRRVIVEIGMMSKYFLVRAHDDTTNPEFLQELILSRLRFGLSTHLSSLLCLLLFVHSGLKCFQTSHGF